MKRKKNIFPTICSMDNLVLADTIARKGKSWKRAIREHDENKEANLLAIREMLLNKTYEVGKYHTFKVFEPKERDVFSLSYYPHCIIQHAIMNELESVFTAMYTADTYSCIKGRGIHKAAHDVRKALRDVSATKYCLKLDIRKFYPSVDHEVLKQQLRRKFKDEDLLWLLGVFIDSADGLPIGNYLSQHLSCFYLTGFDHWIKEQKGVKDYFRYADDIVIFSDSKECLHRLLRDIQEYMQSILKLEVKSNYQIFPVSARGVDFVGYRFYHKYVLLRKGIKKNMAKMYARRYTPQSAASYMGWASPKYCNSYNLLNKLHNEYSSKIVQGLQYKARNNLACG